MRLRSLRIERLPGIHPGFVLDDIGTGVNVVIGPNASGKTSVLRALHAVLYPEELRNEIVDVEATFEDSVGELRAVRIGADLHWQRHGERIDPPPLPDRRFLPCYTLRIEDLLGAHEPTDTEIADHLARELSGGYDLRALRDSPPISLKPTHGRTEAGQYSNADREYRRQLQEQQKLRRDEAGLEELRAQKDQAEHARREAGQYDNALALLEQRRRLRALDARRTQFPDGMDRLRGDELDRLQELRTRHQELNTARDRAVQARTDAEQALTQSGLTGSDLDEGGLGDHRRRLQRLQQLESALAQNDRELARQESALQDSIHALGGQQPARPVQLDPETTDHVERQLEHKRALQQTATALETELAGLPAAAGDGLSLEKLRTGRRELMQWLSAARASDGSALRYMAFAAVLVPAIAALAIGGALLHWGAWLLVLPLAWGIYFLFRHDPGAARRDMARERFRQTELSEPATWENPDVQARLEVLDSELQKAELHVQQFERRAQLEQRLTEARQSLETAREDLRTIASGVGYDPDTLDYSLHRWIHLTSRFDQARASVQELRNARGELANEAERLRSELIDFLTRHNETPEVREPDAELLSGRLERLAARIRDRDRARDAIANADREIVRIDEAIRSCDRIIAEVFNEAGLGTGDESSLRRNLDRLGEWKDLAERLREARVLDHDRRLQLGDRADLTALVDGDDEDTLLRRRDECRARADRLESLIEDITRIDNDIKRAGRDRELEAARTRRQHARDALRERLEEALFSEAGRFLIDEIETEFVEERRPEALHRASEWFRRFTYHQYELQFETGREQPFAALETISNERRKLSELSSGTRMQLLIAVRIAFALEAERGREPLPLSLDEALTTADPERFAAAADSLSLLAGDEGRQVFYLTAQPEDLRYWAGRDPAVHCIDLGEIRGRGRAVSDPEALRITERPAVPEPGTRTAEEYATLLEVPAIDPWRDCSEIPIFYLLRDDLALLRRLLQLGIQRIGSLCSLLASRTAESVLTEAEQRRLQTRVRGAEAWIDAWRQGQGRPVDRHVLEQSGAVSKKYIDPVSALNDQLGGDGSALIRRLEERAVSGFHTNKREDLEAWLSEHGHIDPRDPLSPAEIGLRVVTALKQQSGDDDTAITDGQALAASLESGVRAAGWSAGRSAREAS